MSQDVEITWNGDALTRRAKAGALRGLKLSAEYLLSESTKLVPLDEGTLQDSGKATVDEATMTGNVTYDTPYAVVQHEAMDFVHPNGRQAKYLEEPWMANAGRFLVIIGEQIRRELGT